jgi:WD40 repeat protein
MVGLIITREISRVEMTLPLWERSIAELARTSYRALALSLMSLVAVAPTLCFADVATKSVVIDVDAEAAGMDFSPNGNYLAIDSRGNGGTDIWDFARKRMAGHVKDGGVGVWATDMIHFSPDGRQLAICRYKVNVYNTTTWTPSAATKEAASGAETYNVCSDGLGFTPDGKTLVSLTSDWLVFFDTSTWERTKTIRTVKYLQDEPLVDPKAVYLRDPSDPKFMFISQGGALSFTKDGRYLALGGYSHSKKPWHGEGEFPPSIPKMIVIDLSTNSLSQEIIGGVAALDRSPNDNYIAVGASDAVYTIKILDAASGAVVASEKDGPAHVLLRYTPDGKYLIESIGRKVEIWDGRHEHLLQVIHAEPSCIAISHDSRYFALGGSPNSILAASPLLSLFVYPNGPTGKVIVYKLK